MSTAQEDALKNIGSIAQSMRKGLRLNLDRAAAGVGLRSNVVEAVEHGTVVCPRTVAKVLGYYNPRGDRLDLLRDQLSQAFPSASDLLGSSGGGSS